METQCAILRAPEEREEALALVRRLYDKLGYRETDGSTDIASYVRKKGSMMFGVRLGGALYGTVSVVEDGSEGLPMDSAYADDLVPFRKEGKKIAEVVQFAIDHETYRAQGGRVTLFAAAPLFAAVMAFAKHRGLDYLCITTTQEHGASYERMGFVPLGSPRRYGPVDVIAVAHVLEVPDILANAHAPVILRQIIMRHAPPPDFFADR